MPVAIDIVVLVGMREFESGKGDIIYVYLHDEIAELKRRKEIPTEMDETEEIIFAEAEAEAFDFDNI
jgi:hypothetical protein